MLIVLRHSKAGDGHVDHERRLTGRGHRQASEAGAELRLLGLTPDLVLCSTSQRTRETLTGLGAGTCDAEVHFERRIYDNDVDDLLDLVRAVDESVGTVLLIGHNPSAYDLVWTLAGEDQDGFPTSAFAVIETTQPWAELSHGTCVVRWRPERR